MMMETALLEINRIMETYFTVPSVLVLLLDVVMLLDIMVIELSATSNKP